MIKLKDILKEAIELDIEIGDTILTGKFRNRKTIVKTIDKDEHGMPTINGKKVCTFRMTKKINIFDIKEIKNMKKSQLRLIIAEEIKKITEGNRALYNKIESNLDKKYIKDFQTKIKSIVKSSGKISKDEIEKLVYKKLDINIKEIKKLLKGKFSTIEIEDYIFDTIEDQIHAY